MPFLGLVLIAGNFIEDKYLLYWSGVQKERMEPEDMYVLATNGSILSSPSPKPYPYKPPKCSDCAPLFLKVPVSCFSATNNYSIMSSI